MIAALIIYMVPKARLELDETLCPKIGISVYI